MAQPLKTIQTQLDTIAASSVFGANRIEIDTVGLLRWDTLVLPGRMGADRANLVSLLYRIPIGLT